MKDSPTYLQVILPLKLKWEPFYAAEGDFKPGDRVRVSLSGKEYVGVVKAVGVEPDVDGDRIQSIIGREDLPAVSAGEIRLWEFIAGYYLCSLGEVYKAACPSGQEKPLKKAARTKLAANAETGRRPALDESLKTAVRRIIEAFDSHRNVLLKCDEGRHSIYSELIRRTLESGRDVLYMTPSPCDPFDSRALICDSTASSAQRREIAKLLRSSDEGRLVQGCKNAIFLPWRKLGLIIVEDEQNPGYKQEYSAPRFNGRDCALYLGQLHGADIVLGSPVPSLESWYNACCGKLSLVEVPDTSYYKAEIIDMHAERKKNGVRGEYYSRKLLDSMDGILAEGGKILLLLPWNNTSDAEIEARAIFPKAGAKLVFKPLHKTSDKELEKYPLCVLLKAEYLLGKQDYRADERALQALVRLCGRCQHLIVQTARAEHPVFRQEADVLDRLLQERKTFGLPPYKRDIAVCTPLRKDGQADTVRVVAGRRYAEEHIFLAKDRNLAQNKSKILEQTPPYSIIDVDPQ